MRIALGLFSFVVAGAAALACSSSSDSAPGGGADAGDEASAADDAGGGGEEDAGYTKPDCTLQSTGFKIAKTAKSVARSGTGVEWENPSGATEEDSSSAKVTLAQGEESAALELSDFGFDVPAGALTYGIEVELVRQAPDGGVLDGEINVHIEGKPSRYKYLSTPWPTTIFGTHHYGQAVDTWGVDLYPEDVNKTTFAVSVFVKRAPDAAASVVAQVDSLKVAIHYCPPK